MTNKATIKCLERMKQGLFPFDCTEVCDKAIDALKRNEWHTEPPTEEGLYLIHTDIGVFDFAKYSKDLYKVSKYDFEGKHHRAGWWKYNSEWGFYEVTDVICWMYIPAYEGSES